MRAFGPASALVLLAAATAFAEPAGAPAGSNPFNLHCGPVRYVDTGTVDYRLKDSDVKVKKAVWDLDHFHTSIAAAEMQSTKPYAGKVVDNLDFALRHSPNHHEALSLLIRWDLAGRPLLGFPGARCSLDWARQFAPDDATIYLYGGNYFWKAKDPARARAWYERAVELAPESAEAHYNYGLFLVEQGDFAAARNHARAAYAAGFPLPGLKDKLAKAGYPLVGQP
jgi:tetratricopeptide (TPR) repeat protein